VGLVKLVFIASILSGKLEKVQFWWNISSMTM